MKPPLLKNNLKLEATYLGRYAGSGILNTLVGFGLIFSAMAIGLSPLVANCIGYFVGFSLGFILTKKWVFRSKGHFLFENIRYVVAFLVSFCFNLFVLHSCVNIFRIDPLLSQLIAGASYTSLMFLLSRFFVFREGRAENNPINKSAL